ncbi:protein-L-isoaspartate O-methyltransferase [Polychaeton citri CBS 116435]|uniref:protein-L-isoaspartate(D-aspartate) O-methyltransferase n=1 Tax=Polychaeton citri CBS 116435 TaxID=1314669 RepID=A0A9P4USA0_9PEZI|nr:protein-L-isoaspartate O-methyltransferase [Polychaeton citri CBS 116435]
MAWRSSGSTNEALVTNLFTNGLIASPRVKNAMLSVDRAHYAPAMAYHDSPQPIGYAATISAPHMHASAAESLLPFLRPGARVLDVGSGSGYLTHVLAELIQPGGRVVGVEHITPLVEMGRANAAKSQRGRELMENKSMEFVKGDGRKGWQDDGGEIQEAGRGWDAIHVGAAAAAKGGGVETLIEQLARPGRLFIPIEEGGVVGAGRQWIWVIDKKEDGSVERKREFGVMYVPLTDAPAES